MRVFFKTFTFIHCHFWKGGRLGGATAPGPVKGINASQLPIRNFNDIKGKYVNTTCVFLRDFTQEPKHFKHIFVEKKYLFLFVKRYIFPVQLINVKKTDKWFITRYRMQLWGIRTLAKDNLKNNLVMKNVQSKVSQMSSVTDPTAPKTAIALHSRDLSNW